MSVCVSHDQHYIHDGVDGCIGSQAEVSARDVVADGGWDDAHGDAQLFVMSPGFKQLQDAFVPLWKSNRETTSTFPFTPPLIQFMLFEGCFILYLKPSYNKQS